MTPRVKNVIGAAGIMAVLSGGAIAAVVIAPYFETVALDEETQCPKYRALVSHTIALIDETDPLSDLQARTLRQMLNRESSRLALYGQMTVLLLDPKQYELQNIFSMCAPKNPAQVRDFDGNPKLAQKRWHAAFGKPLDAAIEGLKTVPSSPRSPIIEAIKSLTWRPDFGADVPHRRLVLFTDLLQNSSGLSHYQRKYDFESWRKTPHGRENALNLKGVEVVIFYLQRPDTLRLQSDAHRQFWVDFLLAAGAKVTFADGWTSPATRELAEGPRRSGVVGSMPGGR